MNGKACFLAYQSPITNPYSLEERAATFTRNSRARVRIVSSSLRGSLGNLFRVCLHLLRRLILRVQQIAQQRDPREGRAEVVVQILGDACAFPFQRAFLFCESKAALVFSFFNQTYTRTDRSQQC